MACLYRRNEEFFSEPNGVNSYWAGFLAADGYVNLRSGKILTIHLHRKDRNHLERFKSLTESTAPIRNCHDKCSNFNNSSSKWVDDLQANWSITTNKSLTLRPPPTDPSRSEINLAFIVGYIDGDGCWDWQVSKSQNWDYLRLQIEGTLEMLEWIQAVFPEGTIYTRKARNGWSSGHTLKYVGGKAKRVDEALREVAEDFRLERKWWERDYRKRSFLEGY